MIEIDGSQKSGSGTILRLSIAFAAATQQQLHVYNIRQNRPQPGLKPQHLEAVLTAAKLCNAELEGAKLDSRELWFKPNSVKGGKIEAEIGTAGSIPMLIMTILPICHLAERTVQLHMTKGGTDVSNSPTINYMRAALLPTLKRMGLNSTLTVQKYGYYPKGMGEVTLIVEPCESLKPLRLVETGKVKTVSGISVCTFLEERKVAERQAKAAIEYLRERQLMTDVKIANDRSNPLQKGSSITLWAETDKGAILGADAIGELGKPSEAVGKEAAEKLWREIITRPTVDSHMADMLVPYIALTKGTSTYLARQLTDHLHTNIWLAETMLNAKFKIENVGSLYKIEKA